MRVTAAMSSWNWMIGHLKERGLSPAGISCAMVLIALEQAVSGQPDSRARPDVPGGPHARGAAPTRGLRGVGGPVWAGLIPTSALFQGLRRLVVRGLVRARRSSSDACLSGTAAAPEVGPLPPGMPGRPSFRDAGRMTLSVLIVDDSHAFREISRRLLERQGLEVVGTAETLAEAVTRVAALRPRVALVDINLGRESGFDVARDRPQRRGPRYGGHPHVDPFRE